MKNFTTSKSKSSCVYVLTSIGVAEKAAIAYSFFQREMDEYEVLKAEMKMLRVDADLMQAFIGLERAIGH